MPLALRWLSLWVVLLLSTRAAAHPVLEDSLQLTLGSATIELEVRSTLRPIVVAAGATPQHGSYFAPGEMQALVQAHARYLQQHLSLRVNDQLLAARETHAEPALPITEPVQEHVDLERLHARFSFCSTARVPISSKSSSPAAICPTSRVIWSSPAPIGRRRPCFRRSPASRISRI